MALEYWFLEFAFARVFGHADNLRVHSSDVLASPNDQGHADYEKMEAEWKLDLLRKEYALDEKRASAIYSCGQITLETFSSHELTFS
ncbi:hypothetical protein Peur_000916 [Populus x canadensis]